MYHWMEIKHMDHRPLRLIVSCYSRPKIFICFRLFHLKFVCPSPVSPPPPPHRPPCASATSSMSSTSHPQSHPIPSFAIPPPQGWSTSSLAPIPSSPSLSLARTHILLSARCPATECLLATSSFSRPPPPLPCQWPIAVVWHVPDDGDLPPSSSNCHGRLPYTILGGFRCPTYLHKFCDVQLDCLQLMNVSPIVHVSCRSVPENHYKK
jgi:hypothetical protein